MIQFGASAYANTAMALDHLDLSPQAQALLQGAGEDGEALGRLTEANLYPEAIAFLAGRLPIRKAIWWGLLVLFKATDAKPSPEESALFSSVFLWVRDGAMPCRDICRAALPRLEQEPGSGSLAAAVAAAGFQTEANGPYLESTPRVVAAQVAKAILEGNAIIQQRQLDARLQQLFELGEDIREGKHLWTDKPAG